MAIMTNVTLSGGISLTSPPPQFTISPSVSGKSVWVPSVDGALDLNTDGTWTIVPNKTFNIQVKMWGSAGFSYQRCPSCALGPGGAGGAATGTMQLIDSTTYILRVGGGASNGGGGYAGIFEGSVTQANARIIAGGGGGTGFNCGGPFGCEGSGAGGAGGGTNGQNAGPGGGVSSGTALQGGEPGPNGGGGGGGYWGGGGGTRDNSQTGGTGGTQTAGGTKAVDAPFGASGGAGGGGSGYLHSSIINGTLYSGLGTTPGNSSDPNRGTAGSTTTSTGRSGKIYLYL